MRPQGAKSGLFWPKPASFGQKAGFGHYPGSRGIPGCQPRDPGSRDPGMVYLWSFLIALGKPAVSRRIQGIHGNTGNTGNTGLIRPVGPVGPCLSIIRPVGPYLSNIRPVGPSLAEEAGSFGQRSRLFWPKVTKSESTFGHFWPKGACDFRPKDHDVSGSFWPGKKPAFGQKAGFFLAKSDCSFGRKSRLPWPKAGFLLAKSRLQKGNAASWKRSEAKRSVA